MNDMCYEIFDILKSFYDFLGEIYLCCYEFLKIKSIILKFWTIYTEKNNLKFVV
jgi:hypothetical protein